MISSMLRALAVLTLMVGATPAGATVTYTLFFDDENAQVYLDDFIRAPVTYTYEGRNDLMPFGYCYTSGFATCRYVTFTPGSANDVITVGLSNPVNGNYTRDHVFAAGAFTQVGRYFSTIRSELSVNQFGASPSGVPEPATWGLMLAGFGAVGAGLRSRRRSVTFSAA